MEMTDKKQKIEMSHITKFIDEVFKFTYISNIVKLCQNTRFSVNIGLRYEHIDRKLYVFLYVDIFDGDALYMLPTIDIDYEGGFLCSSTNIATIGKNEQVQYDFREDDEFIEDLKLIEKKLLFYIGNS